MSLLPPRRNAEYMEPAPRNQEPAPALAAALETIRGGAHLNRAQARAAMEVILDGKASDAHIAAWLAALRTKGETVEELVGFAEALRAHARPLFPNGRPRGTLVDTCGTGGDGAGTFNVSTAAAFVVAAAGVRVAKHGNRSLSSRCGSADVLEALGVNILAEPEWVAAAIIELGIGFIFAPSVHTAMRNAQRARRQLGGRTVFNLLGPLTNPAGVDAQVVGVPETRWLEPMAEALGALGVRQAFVVHSRDGLDEASLADTTDVVELRDNRLYRTEVTPEDFGLPRAPREALAGGDAETNAKIIERLFAGERGPPRDIVLMNAALALVAAGHAPSFREGVAQGRDALESGAARDRLRALVEFTNRPRESTP